MTFHVITVTGSAAPPRAASCGILPALGDWDYVTTESLIRDTLSLATVLPADVDVVVAVSRSGLLPGGLLGALLHVPVYTVSRWNGVTDPGHGERLEAPARSRASHALLVDDTAASGTEMTRCLPIVRKEFPRARVTRAVIYAHPVGSHQVDIFSRIYPGQHYLEWNWCNAGHGQACGYDFDGILCRDFTPEEWGTDASYIEAMGRIEPLFLPRRSPVPLVVTARPEWSRGVTEGWLRRHGVRVQSLVMRDFEADPARDWNLQIAAFKACHYARSDLPLFAESDPAQAAEVARLTGKAVLCPALGRVIPPSGTHGKPRVPLGAKPAYG